MNINQVVCVHLNWFAEIKTGTIIGDHQPMRLPLNISSAHYRKTRQFLKAEKIQRNSVILTGKYNKEYCLHVAREFCMYVRLSLALSALTKAMASCARIHCTSNIGALSLRIHWDEQKKIHRSLDGERNSEALSQSVCSARQNIYELNLYVAPKSHTGEYNLGIY